MSETTGPFGCTRDQEMLRLALQEVTLQKRVSELEAAIATPGAVWANMLRGTIAMPGQMAHLEERVLVQAQRIAELETAASKLRIAEYEGVDIAPRSAVTKRIAGYELADNPELDATDAAHPAWWRGNEAGLICTVRVLNERMDKYPDVHGVYGSPELQQLWQRIAALQKRVAEGPPRS